MFNWIKTKIQNIKDKKEIEKATRSDPERTYPRNYDLGRRDGDIRFNGKDKKILIYFNEQWNEIFIPLNICLMQENFQTQKEMLTQAEYERMMMRSYDTVKDAYDQFQFVINMCKDAHRSSDTQSEGVSTSGIAGGSNITRI